LINIVKNYKLNEKEKIKPKTLTKAKSAQNFPRAKKKGNKKKGAKKPD